MTPIAALLHTLGEDAAASLVETLVSIALLVGIGAPMAAAMGIWMARSGPSAIHDALAVAETRMEHMLATGRYARLDTLAGRWRIVQRVDTTGRGIALSVAVFDPHRPQPRVALNALRRVEGYP